MTIKLKEPDGYHPFTKSIVMTHHDSKAKTVLIQFSRAYGSALRYNEVSTARRFSFLIALPRARSNARLHVRGSTTTSPTSASTPIPLPDLAPPPRGLIDGGRRDQRVGGISPRFGLSMAGGSRGSHGVGAGILLRCCTVAMGQDGQQIRRHKIIIDTDPGIDDSMTILMAFGEPSVEIIGLTTIFGNISTEGATQNALLLCEKVGRPEVPVAEGSPEPLKGGKPRIADFVHGSDGIGNLFLPAPSAKKVDESAAEFLVNQVSQFPGEITVLALGPLTNIALAIKSDSSFASNVRKIVVLGGAFFAAGNVNPAAEANIHGDPEAADIVFTSGADIVVVGINITTQVCFTDEDLLELKNSKGKHIQFLSDMCKFYRDWHVKSDGFHGIFLHDPVSFTALVHPEYFTFKKGVVRVETQGICAGHTLMDQGLKKWNSENPWSGYKPISVAWTVDVQKVTGYVKKRLVAL